MEMLDLESGTNRAGGHKKGMWDPTFMSSTSVSPAPLTLMVIGGGDSYDSIEGKSSQ